MLQRCPDCGKEYSTKAAACPNCACPNQIYLDMNSQYKKKVSILQETRDKTQESLVRLKTGLVLLAVTVIATLLFMQTDFAPTHLQSQSFMEFIANPQEWGMFYLTFFIVFYLGTCVLISGGLIRGFLTFIFAFFIFAGALSVLPGFLQAILTVVFFFLPLYLLIIRPIWMLIKVGYFKSRSKMIRPDSSDIFIQQMRDLD